MVIYLLVYGGKGHYPQLISFIESLSKVFHLRIFTNLCYISICDICVCEPGFIDNHKWKANDFEKEILPHPPGCEVLLILPGNQ
jgi:hypothetical protein